MKYRSLRFLLFLLGAVALGAPSLRAAEAPRLNLLLITADDLNADSPGWMGSKMGATPTLDQLAASGHRFVNHHVIVPICQPSREALMTGRLPHHSGALGFNPIKPGTPTLVTTLQTAGYYTVGINKLAHMKPASCFPWEEAIVSGSGKNPPLLRRQFATALQNAAHANKPFFINLNITDPHRPFPGATAGDAEATAEAAAPARNREDSATQPGRPQVMTAEEEANQFRQMRYYKPEEVKVPDFLEDLPQVRVEIAQYFTAVARMDLSLKGVLEALHDSGHEKDTIIVFLGDNGMSFPFSKATVYVDGTWEPVILKYPGMPAAAAHEEFVSSVDIMPTLLDLLGVNPPEGIDGRSWLPLLHGQKQEARDYVITHVNTVFGGGDYPQRCIRTKDWALIFHAWPDGTAKFRVEAMSGLTYPALVTAAKSDARIAERVQQYRVGEPRMFFNERADATERVNLIHDPRSRSEIERLAKILLRELEKTHDPQTANFQKSLSEWQAKPAIEPAGHARKAAADSFERPPALPGQDSDPVSPHLPEQAFGGSRTPSIWRGETKSPGATPAPAATAGHAGTEDLARSSKGFRPR